MKRLVNSLALVVVLVHAVCGCCWHHAHVHDAPEAATCSHQGHGHQGHDAWACIQSQHESPDSEEPACHERTCDFVRTESDVPLDCQLDILVPAEVVAAGSLGRRDAVLPRIGLGPPTRLYLANQTLLL